MRPRIICHMETSIDGKLHPSRFTVPAEGISKDTLKSTYETVADRLGGAGWIVGRATMMEMSKGKPRSVTAKEPLPREPFLGKRGERPLGIAIDPSGKVHYGKDEVGGAHVVAVLGTSVTDDYLAELREDGVSYVFAGADGHDLEAALSTIAERFGVETLLLEGGGGTNGEFLKAGLIDAFSVLIYPAVDGLAGVQSIVDYHGEDDERPGAGRSLRLTHCETLEGGMVWLRHDVEPSPDGK